MKYRRAFDDHPIGKILAIPPIGGISALYYRYAFLQ